jgi:exodeoxyribonuclease VII large subunit
VVVKFVRLFVVQLCIGSYSSYQRTYFSISRVHMPNQPNPPTSPEEKAFSVSEITAQMSSQLKVLGRVLIEGEVSSVTFHRSQHWYFDLKDENSMIRCAMYANVNRKMTWKPKEGDKIRISGKLDVYARTGGITCTVYRMYRAGLGEYLVRLEELRRKLTKEGLFDTSRKRPLPLYPKSIGVATSSVGAAFDDIRKVIADRYPHVTLYLASCFVEGAHSPASIISAIELLNRHGKSDVIIVGRGGGAKESLLAFNEESVVRAIAASKIPIISAVGHEVDSSLSDFAADVRAATPSHAAECAVPSLQAELDKIQGHERVLNQCMNNVLRSKFYHKEGLVLPEPLLLIARLEKRLQEQEVLLHRSMDRLLREKQETLRLLRPMDPLHKIETAIVRAEQLNRLLEQRINQKLVHTEQRLSQLKIRPPLLEIERMERTIYLLNDQLERRCTQQIERKEESFAKQVLGLDSLSPLSILSRGYSVTLKEGKAVLDGSTLSHGDRLHIRFQMGSVDVRVEGTEPQWIQGGLFEEDI